MRTRKEISDVVAKPERSIGLYERQLQVEGLLLEVLLDIRDLLETTKDNTAGESYDHKGFNRD